MSIPISAITTSATRWPIPGIVHSSGDLFSERGQLALISSSSRSIVAVS